MGGRPVVAFGRDDEDVAVLAELLAVVLADVRVVPVDAGIGERDAVGEAAAHRDRRLRLVGAVVAVLEPQTVPVNRRLEVAFVDDVDDELGALADANRRTGHRAVVGDHANGVVAEALRDRRDPQLEPVAVAELDDLRSGRLGQARRLRREVLELRLALLVVVVVMLVMFHRQIPSAAPAACGARLSFVSGAGSLPPPSWRGDEGGVVGDEAEQRRAAGVLPGEAEEVEPRHLGDAATVAQSARRRPSPAARSRSGRAGSRSPRSRRRPPARCRRRSRSCGPRRGRRAAAPGRRGA